MILTACEVDGKSLEERARFGGMEEILFWE
jgi:hypothetical protein